MADTRSAQLPEDRILRWPFYSGLALLFLVNLAFSWPVAAIAFSILFLLWALPFAIVATTLLCVALWSGAVAALRRHWRAALSTLALPVLLVVSVPLSSVTDQLVNHAHFQIFKSEYLASIETHVNTDRAGLEFFDWGGNVMIGFTRFLAFDESDEIIVAPSQRSQAFRTKLQVHGFGGHEAFRPVQTVAPHFNIVDCCW